MPHKLHISTEVVAQRHVLGQQLYRLRKRYRLLVRNGLLTNASVVRERILTMESKYESLGGYPHHPGNVL